MNNHIIGNASILINASVDQVWEALTEPGIIKQYFFNTNTKTDWKAGSPIVFSGEYEGKSYVDKGTVLDVEKNKHIKYTYWSQLSGMEDKPENYVTITYKLSEQLDGTLLQVSQENIPNQEMKKHSEENWKKVLNNLKKLLEERSATAH
jgi:uncharacterized protein YndB with AHSA1/START domain